MEPAAKRVRAGSGSAGDRLGALSDEILRRVLSFLPSRQAVQTTVLSKRWIDLWRSVPAIDLDIRDFGGGYGYGDGLCGWRKMTGFTTDLLMLHNAECLDAFRLKLDDPSVYRGPDFNRWIRRAIKYDPLVLEIHVNRSLCRQLQIPRPGSTFRRLKRLELIGMSLDHSFAERLNSGCPVLEDLVLDYCRNEFDGIQSDTLKNLVVHTCSSGVADILVIRAPCLASLSLKFPFYYYKNGISLDAGNSLVRASISVVGYELFQRAETILVGSLFNVTSLELKSFGAMAILDKELDKFPIFDNLRTLSLDWCFKSKRDVHKFKALGRFLQKSPNLEKLTPEFLVC